VLGLRWSEVDLPRQTARLADTKTGASPRTFLEAACAVIDSQPSTSDLVFASRSGEKPIVGYRKTWLRITKLGDLPADITPHVLRHSFASLAAGLGYNAHNVISRCVHSTDAVAIAKMKLMGQVDPSPTPERKQVHLPSDRPGIGSVVRDEIKSL
jgi:integrase